MKSVVLEKNVQVPCWYLIAKGRYSTELTSFCVSLHEKSHRPSLSGKRSLLRLTQFISLS